MKKLIVIVAVSLFLLPGCASNPYYQAAKAYICDGSE